MPLRDFAGVYDEHVWRVYGFFAYRLSSRADAEDLTQGTFERALRAWGTYDASRASAATWLLAIARNLLVDHLRARPAARPLSVEAIDLEAIAAPPDRHSLGLDPGLERALAELGPRERELIALRFGGDLRNAEIAELTGLSLANVQQILSRSLRRMRASLDGAASRDGGAAVAARRAGSG
ncbi:MAG TPA: sigma-70 family RNA polymerase sigma factor [Conexibacter sp.]|jgi:RNA polymerase sigma factor (sigma-70 family)|nr:sigma-70 family RNA polymerase sigma factor [Conexibacter sp.]